MHQLPLIANLEASDDAYRAAIRDCRLPASAEAVAVWLFDHGRREVVDGQRCQVARARSKTQLAAAVRTTASSAYRGVRKLLDLGLVERHGEDWVLVVTRCCVVGEIRTTGEERLRDGLDRGWSAETTAARLAGSDRGPPGPPGSVPVHPGSPLVHPGSGRFTPVQPSLRSEKEDLYKPDSLTETDNRFGSAANRVNRCEPARTAVNRDEPVAVPLSKPGDLGAAKRVLNRTPAWQALQEADFAGGPPPVEKLRDCYRAAVRCGVLRDCRDAKLQFLATAYDCAASQSTRNPAGALVYRTAAGTLHWATVPGPGYQWAKSIVDGRPVHRTDTESNRPVGVGELAACLVGSTGGHL